MWNLLSYHKPMYTGTYADIFKSADQRLFRRLTVKHPPYPLRLFLIPNNTNKHCINLQHNCTYTRPLLHQHNVNSLDIILQTVIYLC